MTITRAMVVEEARKWIGVPWRHQGRTRFGVDCVGLLVMVCRALRISDADLQGYARRPVGAEFIGHFAQRGALRIAILDAVPGNIIVLRASIFPCHVGILSELSGRTTIIHSMEEYGKVVENTPANWTHQRIAAFALPGVE